MQSFILLTRLNREESDTSFSVRRKEQSVVAKVQELIPEVKWISDYALLGPWDYMDVVQAPDMMTAIKLSALVRFYGDAHTEVWPAVNWDCFEKAAEDMSADIRSKEIQ